MSNNYIITGREFNGEERNKIMKFGYIRVSTQEQNLDRQRAIMEAEGVDKIFEEKASGKNADRAELKRLLGKLRQGDVLIVESYSRLARNTRDLLAIVEQLSAEGVTLISKKENLDTSTPSGRLMLTVFAGLAQFERECILERQREGIKCAKEAGKYKGRPKAEVPTEFRSVMEQWLEDKITAVQAMKLLGMTRNTFYRRANEYKKETGMEG